MKEINLNYVIFALTPRVRRTMQIFDDCGLEFSEQTIDKDNPEEFTFYAASEICKRIEQNGILVQVNKEREQEFE